MLQDEDPETLLTATHLAACLVCQKAKTAEAEALFREVLEARGMAVLNSLRGPRTLQTVER
jgi:hypothetical protein